MQDLPNGAGGGGRTRVGLCGGGGGGGGGRRSKHWPPGAGDPRYATACPPTRLPACLPF